MTSRFLTAALALALAVPAVAQDRASDQANRQDQTMQAQAPNQGRTTASITAVPAGKRELEGVIVRRDADTFVLRDETGAEYTVALGPNTVVKEKKSNPFRGARKYAVTSLVRGLNVEVKGNADNSGQFMAREIKTKDTDMRVAMSIETRVNPVEERVASGEENARRMSGQIEELTSIANVAKGGAAAAQETADRAIVGVQQAEQRIGMTNERISALDDYEPAQGVTVTFKVGSAVLSADSKAQLDQLAEQAKTQRGYVIQVAGFASADGSEDLNRRLSQRRADAVIRYLAENHNVPLRRIITPFGYGEAQPVADNKTRDGRQQNRRVEVTILVNKGILQQSAGGASTTATPMPGRSTNDMNTPSSNAPADTRPTTDDINRENTTPTTPQNDNPEMNNNGSEVNPDQTGSSTAQPKRKPAPGDDLRSRPR